MSRVIDTYMRFIYQMGSLEWFLVLLTVFVVGVFCMRGYGSRTNY